MTIIEIDKSTIKRNKDAFKTTSHFYNGETITFEGKTTDAEIERLKTIKGIDITVIAFDLGEIGGKTISGYLDNIDLMSQLPKGFNIEGNKKIGTINHLPIAEYSFEYKNPLVQCQNCGGKVLFTELETGVTHNEDGDEIDFDVCPLCMHPNTFEYEFQSITDIEI